MVRRLPSLATWRPFLLACGSAFIGGLLLLAVCPAQAVPSYANSYNYWANAFGFYKFDRYWQSKAGSAETAQPLSTAATFNIANFGADTEPGEPNESGRMKKTVWGKLRLPQAGRVVIHTFGSDFDTALAVYTGNAVDKLKKVTSNDNHAAPGYGATRSLVQFDAKAGVTYSIQIGSKTGAEGDLYVNVFAFPPGGGLAAYLGKLDGSGWEARDYVCGYGGGGVLPQCRDAQFLIHNSTSKTLRISSASNLGAGIQPPAPFDLAPGELGTATYVVTGAFDKTSVRTVAGFLTLTGRKGSTVVDKTRHRALIVVKPPAPPDVLSIAATPEIRTGYINEALDFRLRVTNSGASEAIGCHVRSRAAARLRTVWEPADAKGHPIAAVNTPITIPANATRTILAHVASQQTVFADPTFPDATEVEVDCANTHFAALDLGNVFGISTPGNYDPAEIVAKRTSPAAEVLKVPAGTTRSFSVSAVNRGRAGTIIARPQYIHPFGEDEPDKHFKVKVCRTDQSGNCIGGRTDSVNYHAAPGATRTFKVFVTAPASDPGFDPRLRRVLLIFLQKQPPGAGPVPSIPVGTESIAVRRK